MGDIHQVSIFFSSLIIQMNGNDCFFSKQMDPGWLLQPLHVGFTTDRGGNTINVHWFTRKAVLHHVSFVRNVIDFVEWQKVLTADETNHAGLG